MAKVYLKEAHENDENPQTVYVLELDGTDNDLGAMRLDGKWKSVPMTVGTLEKDYTEIEDPAVVDHLVTEARRSLSDSPVRAK
jgi:hypothetical protein